MKTALIITIALLVIVAGCVVPEQTNETTPPSDSGDAAGTVPAGDERYAAVDCPADHPKGDGPCTLEYAPVCADGVTYGNKCQACRNADAYFPVSCEDLASDAFPPEETAGDEITMQNDYTLCTDEQRNVPCTREYVPVCANKDNGIRCVTTPCDSTDQETYGNACSACADPDVYGYIPGACETIQSKCAAGNVMYATQLGFACIPDYTPEQITSWNVCTSPAQCGGSPCVRADRLPNGQEIGWEGMDLYRCVPEDYFNFLLHSSGASGIDEDGEKYTVIA